MTTTSLTVTDDSFRALVLQSHGLVLLDVWATWCAPCKALAPVLDEIARQFTGTVQVAELDADANPRAVEQLGVRGLPTVLLFKDGAEQGRIAGAVSKTRLVAMIEDAVEGA